MPVYKGMKAGEGKNFLKEGQSKKFDWKDIGVPKWLSLNLTGMPLMYEKPSSIQAQSIPLIFGDRDQNFIFQYKYGSGKKRAIAVPAVMTVDPTIKDYQVIILCHTKELIQYIADVIEILVKGSQVTVSKGIHGEKLNTHILVTSVGYIKNLLASASRGNDKNIFSKVKMIVFDEADAIFNVSTNLPEIN